MSRYTLTDNLTGESVPLSVEEVKILERLATNAAASDRQESVPRAWSVLSLRHDDAGTPVVPECERKPNNRTKHRVRRLETY